MQTYYPTPNVQRLVRVECFLGEIIRIAVDWRSVGTVSSSSWAVSGSEMTASDAGLTNSVADCLLSADYQGMVSVENRAVFTDGQAKRQQFEILIRWAIDGDVTTPVAPTEYLEYMTNGQFTLMDGGSLELSV